MSIDLIANVWRLTDPDLHGSRLLILLALADYANDDGLCWPAMASLAQRTRISERQARRSVHWLAAHGYLTIDEQRGRTKCNRYHITLKPATENRTSATENRTSATENRTSDALKPDIAMSPKPIEPPKELVGWLDHQPTNGGNAAQTPKPPAVNDPGLEALAVALLSEIGVAMHTVKELVALRPFAQIRRHVFAWLKEHRAGKAETGLLVYRLRKDDPCPDPDPDTDRALWNRYRTPAERQADAAAQQELEELMHRPAERPPAPPKPTPPANDDPWAITLMDLGMSRPELAEILARATAEHIGEQGEAQVWQITLDPADANQAGWIKARGAILIRKTLASIAQRAVLVDVLVPEPANA